jgi:DNA-binding response OmpR family regulator
MSEHRPSPEHPLVLIVEDHADTCDMYRDYLQFVGFRVLCAATAERAIESALAHHPAVIVMDVQLPTMTGTEAVTVLKSHPTSASIPILLLSGHAMAHERAAGLSAGADQYVSKPCLPEELANQIRALVKRPPSGGNGKSDAA